MIQSGAAALASGPIGALEAAWLGQVAYAPALHLQESLRAQLLDEKTDPRAAETLLLLEHDPVITLGRSANPEHVLYSQAALSARGIDVVRTNRGGDVTYHGPGQLVAYPIVHLDRGVEAHVLAMAEAVIEVAAAHSIAANYRRETPGVWVADRKLCAFGVHVHRRVAIHGLALNVSTPLDAFSAIVPCGLASAGVTSLATLTGRDLSLRLVAQQLATALSRRLSRSLRFLGTCSIDSLLSRSPPVR